MKRTILVLLAITLFATVSIAGEIVTLPKYLVLTNPTTNQVDKESVTFYYGPPAYAIVQYKPVDSEDRAGRGIRVKVKNEIDNPYTAIENCLALEDPFPGCTGLGTGGIYQNPVGEVSWDETSTDFTDLVSGFGVTLKTRADAIIYIDAQNRYETQDTP